MRQLVAARLADQDAERVRRSHVDAIVELQQLVTQRQLVLARLPMVLSGNGSLQLPDGTCVVELWGIGQGGGGGGGGGAGSTGFGAGGSSGASLYIWIGAPGTPLRSLLVTWQAGNQSGAGGGSAGTNGNPGSSSTIEINGFMYTMVGGGGGGGMASPGAAASTAISTAPAAGTTPGGIVTYGLGGDGLVMPAQAAGYAGFGGSTHLGAGGAPRVTAGAGNPGSSAGFGGGGGGGVGGAAGGDGAFGGFMLVPFR